MDDVSKLKITLKGPQEFVENIFQKPIQGSEEDLERNERNELIFQVNADERSDDVDENADVVQSGIPSCGSDRGLIQKGGILAADAKFTDGCTRITGYDNAESVRENICNSSFEKSDTGTFNNCVWNTSNTTCSTETEECVPEMAGNTDIPYCASSVWQPGYHLGVTGDRENPTLPYCYCKDGDTGTNFNSENGRVSRCLVDRDVSDGRLEDWMNSGRLPTQSGTE